MLRIIIAPHRSSFAQVQLVDNSANYVTPGALTDKGDVSRKEKDFFGDPSMWRRGRGWYEKIWPTCPKPDTRLKIAVDATPAYHVWHSAPQNMRTFFGDQTARLRVVWMLCGCYVDTGMLILGGTV